MSSFCKIFAFVIIAICYSSEFGQEPDRVYWVKNGDDYNSTLSVAVNIVSSAEDDENEYFIEKTIRNLKEAIMIDPILSPLYESIDLFNIFFNGTKLHDHFPLSLLNSDDILECKLRVPEVYKIRRLRTLQIRNMTSARKVSFSDQWISNTDIGYFKRIVNGDSQSFIQLGVLVDYAPDIKTFPLSNREFTKNKKIRVHQKNVGSNGNSCYDTYTFEPQNLFFVRFEFESTRPDGVYWISRFNESGESFHRFTLVSVTKIAFMVERTKDTMELDKLAVSGTRNSVRIKVKLGAYYDEIISFRKLTNFAY